MAKSVLVVLVAGLALFGAAPAPAQTSAVAVLRENWAAMDLPREGRLEASYAFAGYGLSGSASRAIDLASGAFVENFSGGPVSLGSGFDTHIPWMKDFSGAFTPEEGGDRRALAVNQAYRFANLWWRPDFDGANILYRGRESAGGAASDHLVVTPAGGKPFDAWFDVHTHLLVRVREAQGFATAQTFYSDYEKTGGMMLPRVTTIDPGAGPPSDITLTLERATLRPALPLSAYSRPIALPADFEIAGGAPSETIAFRLLNNHIYVPVTVNGKGPYTFIVDTGGHLALAPHLAAALGAASAGHAAASGAGEKISTTGFTHVGEIALGRVRLRDQTAFVTEVYATAVEGIRVDGMLGFELFRRFGVRIDYGRQVLTVFDPSRYRTPDTGAVVPFRFYDHLPDVAGAIDGIPARFDIDTGSRSELDITSPFVARHALHAKYPGAVEAVTGWGVGGPVTSSVIRLPSLTLGAVRVDGPVGELSDAAHGSFSDPNYDGNIGSALLKRFVVTFDYRHQHLFLEPVRPLPPDVGTFDKSGMWFNAGSNGYVVTALDPGGPAAGAGVETGDIITAIDGSPAQSSALSEARRRFRIEATGKVVSLAIVRAGEHKSISLTLRDLIPQARP